MKVTKLSRLTEQYLAALRAHSGQGPQAGLQAAGKLGREAVAIGLETLDLAKIHDRALAELMLPDYAEVKRDDLTRHAAIFFAEAILPIEKTHRSVQEASAGLNQLSVTLDRRTLDLADSNRELERGITERKTAVEFLKTSKIESARLLEESCHLQKHLQELAHQILSAQEDERKTMSLRLQDEIAQTLLGIHVRLLALKKEVSLSHTGFKKEVATTQRLVQESVKTINRVAREFGIQHE